MNQRIKIVEDGSKASLIFDVKKDMGIVFDVFYEKGVCLQF